MSRRPTRLTMRNGALVFVHVEHDRLVQIIDRARRNGQATIRVDDRSINVDQIAAVRAPDAHTFTTATPPGVKPSTAARGNRGPTAGQPCPAVGARARRTP